MKDPPASIVLGLDRIDRITGIKISDIQQLSGFVICIRRLFTFGPDFFSQPKLSPSANKKTAKKQILTVSIALVSSNYKKRLKSKLYLLFSPSSRFPLNIYRYTSVSASPYRFNIKIFNKFRFFGIIFLKFLAHYEKKEFQRAF